MVLMQKLLGVKQPVSIRELCIQFGCGAARFLSQTRAACLMSEKSVHLQPQCHARECPAGAAMADWIALQVHAAGTGSAEGAGIV